MNIVFTLLMTTSFVNDRNQRTILSRESVRRRSSQGPALRRFPRPAVMEIFNGEEKIQGKDRDRHKTRREINAVMPGDKIHVAFHLRHQQQIVDDRKNADEGRYHHEQKSAEDQVPLQVGREADDPLRPRAQFPEKIDIDEIEERKAVLVGRRRSPVEIKEHEEGDECGDNDLYDDESGPRCAEKRNDRVPFAAEVRCVTEGHVKVEGPQGRDHRYRADI